MKKQKPKPPRSKRFVNEWQPGDSTDIDAKIQGLPKNWIRDMKKVLTMEWTEEDSDRTDQ